MSAFSSVGYHYQLFISFIAWWKVLERIFSFAQSFYSVSASGNPVYRSNIDRLLLPPGGWGSGVVPLLVVPCARLPCWEGCPSQLTHLCVGWLGDSRGPGEVYWAANSCVDRLVASSGSHPLALSVYRPLGVEIIAESVAQTALGMGFCALAPWPVWTAFADVLFTFGGWVGFFDTNENEYYFLFYSFLLAMSEVFYICPGMVTLASRDLSFPFF